MNDQQPHAGYDTYPTGSFSTDPLFGGLPGTGDHSGQYDTTQWDTGSHQNLTAGYDAYGAHAPQQDYGTTGTWTHLADIPAQGGPAPYDTQSYQADAMATGQWDATAWNEANQVHSAPQSSFETGQFETGQFETGQFDATQYAYGADSSSGHQWQPYDPSLETGAFDATAWNTGADQPGDGVPDTPEALTGATDVHTTEFPIVTPSARNAHDAHTAHDPHDASDASDPAGSSGPGPEPEPAAVGPRAARRVPANRGRRRTPAKRSALFTIAVPSACVMGVAGIAAASVSGVAGADETKKPTTMAAADPATVKPVAVNNKLDTQLAALSTDARDFGDRASRTQERIDLKERQDAEKKRKAEEAARKEAARPKYALPVSQHGLSAYYGQAGVNWAAVHTGIDFPVDMGTPVMAATDGTVSYQFNSAYGNMMKVVSPNGVETWYCHLSRTKMRSGSVKAGDVIGYAGTSGNSTGAHLHFEVRPSGGSAIDPLAWLRSHDLDPT
ncbi:peptidoglycan DD-metalloendopeptidase family protein [Streptomyces sp. NBC_00237]|uniref:M23 family metallopeptidase n=1 Tax=Streptomyces sp. NBC_00237 TaxID=2975687 RepID=UPI0022557381|nr:peptidoglycan DD-metalloendopeptidase family protein [Streptomyces sp. NBC_00237]MCX5204735.1 peptidoglycan DD-metalloendopeptidase family protein [Streptomyces sp. NBC_00237]